MKKTNILLIFLLFGFSFLMFSKSSFAQNSNSSLFDTANPIRQEKINANAKTTLAISLFPFSTIIIKPGSFNEDVTLYISLGIWNKLKTALPKDQSPISSYYLVFKSKDGTVYPSNPLSIESYNNYINTNTFFYPLSSPDTIDTANQKNWPGHIRVRTDLPVKDSGFIVAANIDLKPNDSSLHPKPITPSIGQNTTVPKTDLKADLLIPALALLIIIIIIFLTIGFLILKRWNKKS